MKRSRIFVIAAAIFLNLAAARPATAGDFTGKVEMLEVWDNGNVSVSLSLAITGCNAQVILNLVVPCRAEGSRA